MVVITDSLHKLARLNYFKHSPDVVVVGGNGFVGRCICKIAAQSGLVPVSISVDPCPPVYSEEDKHNYDWVTRTHWREGDATKPSTWDPHIVDAGCTAMVYTTKPVYRSKQRLWECNFEGALQSIEMARKMHANRFVYISTNFMPPLATQAERETKKRAEEALMEYSKMSLSTDSPIGLSILKPGWIYGGDRISSSVIGLLCHFLFDWDCKKQPPRNVSSISVQTLAMAAICQALDPGLSNTLKLYNHQMQIYNDPKARHWLENMAECMYNRKHASCTAYDY
ncbi:hypothetical protein WA171_000582, partial [Blastocystis sp. BT1]